MLYVYISFFYLHNWVIRIQSLSPFPKRILVFHYEINNLLYKSCHGMVEI